MKYLMLCAIVLLCFVSCKKSSVSFDSQTNNSTQSFGFDFDGSYVGGTTFDTQFSATDSLLVFAGSSDPTNPDPKYYLALDIVLPTGNIVLGKYIANVPPISIGTASIFNESNGTINGTTQFNYFATSGQAQLVINITGYNPSTKEVTCSFYGSLQNQNDNSIHSVTNGNINGIVKQ